MTRSSLRAHETHALEITRLAPTAHGIAEAPDGTEVHVPGALPGERVRVRIDVVNRQVQRAFATIQGIVRKHPARRTPPCAHQDRCGGCPLMHAREPHQRELKRAVLREAYGLKTDRVVHLPDGELGYRWSSKRVAGGVSGAVILGSFRRGSHELANMERCLVDHPAIASCARQLADVAGPLGIEPYQESSQTGLLRYGWFKTDGSGDVLVSLVLARADRDAARRLSEKLSEAAGVSWCVQPSTGNVLRGEDLEVLSGRDTLQISVGSREVAVGPLDFLQPNPRAAKLAYRDLLGTADAKPLGGQLVLDLYAGSGATTAMLREAFAMVVPCEAFPASAAALGIEPERVEGFLERWVAGTHPAAPPTPEGHGAAPVELVVANPPRAGLGAAACELLARLGPPRIHLMSCHPAAMRRDLDRLTGPEGAYRLAGLRAYDTLPQTPHVELVAWLELR